jgi:hypothetical protein
MANDSYSEKIIDLNQLGDVDELTNLIYKIIRENPGREDINLSIIRQHLEAIEKFNTLFNQGTSDADSFLSLSEIEKLVLQLQESHSILSRELASEKMLSVDEVALILKKKVNTPKMG